MAANTNPSRNTKCANDQELHLRRSLDTISDIALLSWIPVLRENWSYLHRATYIGSCIEKFLMPTLRKEVLNAHVTLPDWRGLKIDGYLYIGSGTTLFLAGVKRARTSNVQKQLWVMRSWNKVADLHPQLRKWSWIIVHSLKRSSRRASPSLRWHLALISSLLFTMHR